MTREAFRPAIRFHIGNDAYQKFDIMRTISEIIEQNGREKTLQEGKALKRV